MTDTGDVTQRMLAAWECHLGHDVDMYDVLTQLTEGTLPEALHRMARLRPEHPALIVDGEMLTHGEIDRRVSVACAGLQAKGVRPGDRVLLCGASSLDLVICYLSILRAAATMVPASHTSTEPELAHLVVDSEAAVAVAESTAFEHLTRIAVSGWEPRALLRLGEAARPAPGSAVELEVVPRGGDVAILAYTSGTTGRAKAVPLTHTNLLSSIRGAMLAWRWTADDVLVHALPLSHQHGLGGVHATLLAGSTAAIQSKFDPERLCATLAANRATVLFAVPAQYARLVGVEPRLRESFSTLRLAISGSSAMSPALSDEMQRLFGVRPLERYGTTESGLDVSNPYEGETKPGAVGLALPGVDLQVVDAEGKPCKAGTDGEVTLRGPQVFAGYWRMPEATAASFFPGGWFRTGDVGCVDPNDGYLSITGRSKEVIITGGLNVYPREVELALEAHPDVQSAGVIGLPSDQWGEAVTAFVVPVPGRTVTDGELHEYMRVRLNGYKCPKRIFFIDALPLNAIGKLTRSDLKSLVPEQTSEIPHDTRHIDSV